MEADKYHTLLSTNPHHAVTCSTRFLQEQRQMSHENVKRHYKKEAELIIQEQPKGSDNGAAHLPSSLSISP